MHVMTLTCPMPAICNHLILDLNNNYIIKSRPTEGFHRMYDAWCFVFWKCIFHDSQLIVSCTHRVRFILRCRHKHSDLWRQVSTFCYHSFNNNATLLELLNSAMWRTVNLRFIEIIGHLQILFFSVCQS